MVEKQPHCETQWFDEDEEFAEAAEEVGRMQNRLSAAAEAYPLRSSDVGNTRRCARQGQVSKSKTVPILRKYEGCACGVRRGQHPMSRGLAALRHGECTGADVDHNAPRNLRAETVRAHTPG